MSRLAVFTFVNAVGLAIAFALMFLTRFMPGWERYYAYVAVAFALVMLAWFLYAVRNLDAYAQEAVK